MDELKLRELIREELSDQVSSGASVSTAASAADIQRLRDLRERLMKPTDFSEGDIVVWKEGLKNRRMPNYGQRAIVISRLDEPVFDNNGESGSPYFREPLDLVIGFFDADDDFILFYYDSRRFQKVDA